MRRPRYTEELFKMVFLLLGLTFIFMGLLSYIGVMKPTSDSMVQEPKMMGIVFSLVGIAFLTVQTILKIIASSKKKLHNELLISGTRINGIVENIYRQTDMRYAGESPYRILYTYTWQGKVYHHHSHLLWDIPDFKADDSIVVYVNDSGKSTIQL